LIPKLCEVHLTIREGPGIPQHPAPLKVNSNACLYSSIDYSMINHAFHQGSFTLQVSFMSPLCIQPLGHQCFSFVASGEDFSMHQPSWLSSGFYGVSTVIFFSEA